MVISAMALICTINVVKPRITVVLLINCFTKLVALVSDLLSCSTRGLVTLACLLPKLAAAWDVVPCSAHVTLLLPSFIQISVNLGRGARLVL